MYLEKLALYAYNRLGRPRAISGFISSYGLDNRRWLLTLLPRHSVGAEIGVFKGDFSERLFHATEPAEFHLIDVWQEREEYEAADHYYEKSMDYYYRKVKARFSQHQNVQIHRKESQQALKTFQDNYFDWVYVDGDHAYQGVKGDLELCLKKVKPGGLICGDDYVLGRWWGDGVVRAVNELIQNGKVEVIRIENRQFVLKNLR